MIYKAASGRTFVFGRSGSNVFSADIGTGLSVRLGTSQGFGQIGETVDTQTAPGRTINIKGVIYGKNITGKKSEMRNTITPLSTGRLIIDNRYFIDVTTKKAPTFTTDRWDGKFSVQLFAQFPFFSSVTESVTLIGQMIPMFSFPLDLSQPHQFGSQSPSRTANVINSGDVSVPYHLTIKSAGSCTNVTITEISTQKHLTITGTLNLGDQLDIYRDQHNVLRAILEASGGSQEDAISRISEDSDLFELSVGDNVLTITDDESGSASLTAWIKYHEAVGGVYET